MKTIFVRFQREGFHCYPEAPDEVSFLRHEHRHLFFFEVEMEVKHDNREVEFFMFKRELENLYGSGQLQLNHMSCEMIAEKLLEYVVQQYGNRHVMVSVSEDNENGARVYSE